MLNLILVFLLAHCYQRYEISLVFDIVFSSLNTFLPRVFGDERSCSDNCMLAVLGGNRGFFPLLLGVGKAAL